MEREDNPVLPRWYIHTFLSPGGIVITKKSMSSSHVALGVLNAHNKNMLTSLDLNAMEEKPPSKYNTHRKNDAKVCEFGISIIVPFSAIIELNHD